MQVTTFVAGVISPDLTGWRTASALTLAGAREPAVQRLPRTSAADVRTAADALGFVIAAEAAVRRSAFPAESDTAGRAIAAFRRIAAGQDVYVLTPLVNLDPMEADRHSVYAGPLAQSGLQAMATIAPVLRGLDRRVSSLERFRAQEEELRRWDPMILAIPRGADLATYDGPALIGPCWGPDLELIGAALTAAQHPESAMAVARYWGR